VGWVRNTPGGVQLEIEGSFRATANFLDLLNRDTPPLAVITRMQVSELPPAGGEGFAILPSSDGVGDIQIAPDNDVCKDCLDELFDPTDRRYLYPFITCTNCGPRYTIVTGIPYDRPLTTMASFPLCPDCRKEYENPTDRRFHAQPLACPVCGPVLSLVDSKGALIEGDPLQTTVERLKAGQIVAIKGIGGFHVAVDAGNEQAVLELRRRKKREEKPFALMASDLAAITRFAHYDEFDRRLLESREKPIVLLLKASHSAISSHVAPGNGWFGVMLPSSPLHHLLLRDNFPALVMTSGNLSDEPIAYRNDDALVRLSGIADAFLLHNRDIFVPCDDSVIRTFDKELIFLRRSRGYVPRAIMVSAQGKTLLAVGAELKSTVCVLKQNRACLSQHIGDLKNPITRGAFEGTITQLERILDARPEVVAHDLHPDYLSTAYAQSRKEISTVAVQHHHAHMAACMAENGLAGDTIGVIFDGAGFGTDGTVWGGEFLVGGYRSFERLGRIAPVPLPGGDAAAKEPYRMAIAWFRKAFGGSYREHLALLGLPVTGDDLGLLEQVMAKGINSPLTSSCGRLFDAVAALLGLRMLQNYEGQAAMELEALAEQGTPAGTYGYEVGYQDSMWEVDFSPLFKTMAHDLERDVPRTAMARMFHVAVASAATDMCDAIRKQTGLDRVVLSGGVFQNRLLTADLTGILRDRGFMVFSHRLVPPNDGGVALGQAMVAAHGQ
jgi:hydrogenase maturation protein HypF